jgi:hypothetical protein
VGSDEASARTITGAGWMTLARKAGYDFSREELDQARREGRTALSNEDLNGISGGVNTGGYTGGMCGPGETHNPNGRPPPPPET